MARRLDAGESDRNYNSNKRARVSSRARDDQDSRNRTHPRRRDSISSSTRARDKTTTSNKKSSASDSPLDWMRLDHERLAQRAQAIANQRRVQDQDTEVEKPLTEKSDSVEAPRTPSNPPPNSTVPPLTRDQSSMKKSAPRREILTPSSLNLSEITMSFSDLGSSQASDSNAMDVDNPDCNLDEENALLDP